MPTRSHLVQVARKIQRQLGDKPMLTLNRLDVTDFIREVSGEDTTRMKARMGSEVEDALRDVGVRCFPPLSGTTTGDVIRFFAAGSPFGDLVNLLVYPDPEQDQVVERVLDRARAALRGR